MKQKFQIIHHDDDIIVVNKSANLLSIPDRYSPEKENLQGFLNRKFEKTFVVHRLDKETSGIMVFAKNEKAHAHLSKQFENRETQKIYLALTEGRVVPESGIIKKSIAPNQGGIKKMVISTKGKPSETHYKVREYFKNYSLIECDIKTGRTHQIRVHLESIGYPLAIDSIYGRKESFLLSDIKLKKYRLGKNQEERPLMTRHTLHAFQLSFRHPSNDEKMTFEAELPKDFRAVLSQLRKWGK